MISFPVAGAKFRPMTAKQALLSAAVDSPVRLEAEPTNPHDRMAIKLLIDEPAAEGDEEPVSHFIGYVPKASNLEVHELANALEVDVSELPARILALNGLYTEIAVEAA